MKGKRKMLPSLLQKIALQIIAATSIGLLSVQSSLAASCATIPVPSVFKVDPDTYSGSPPYSLDESGVLIRDYGAAYGGLGKFHNPLFIATYALALHKAWEETGCVDAELIKRFDIQVKWLLNNFKKRGEFVVWEYPFRNENYGLEAGWYSGITQTRVASVLFRAAEIHDKKEIRAVANAALLPYKVPTIDGGLIVNEGGTIWIEEAPDPSGKPNKILNGHLSGLQFLIDANEISDIDFGDIIKGAIAAVRRDISLFDAGFISFYSLGHLVDGTKPIANRNDYNLIHVDQLRWLAEFSGDELFSRWADVFEAYDQREDTMTAYASIDPEGHGPDKATDLYYSHYWSSRVPTWIQSSFEKPVRLLGVHIGSHRSDVIPVEFTIYTRENGIWTKTKSFRNNDALSQYVMFDDPKYVDAVRMEIKASHRPDLTALDSFTPIRGDIDRPVPFIHR